VVELRDMENSIRFESPQADSGVQVEVRSPPLEETALHRPADIQSPGDTSTGGIGSFSERRSCLYCVVFACASPEDLRMRQLILQRL